MWILLAIIIAIVLLVLYFYPQSTPYIPKHRSQVVCYYSDHCPYCKDLLDTGKWKKVEDYFRNSKQITVTKIEEKENPELIAKHGISGFPTIRVLRDDGVVEEYNDRREPESIIKFVESFTRNY